MPGVLIEVPVRCTGDEKFSYVRRENCRTGGEWLNAIIPQKKAGFNPLFFILLFKLKPVFCFGVSFSTASDESRSAVRNYCAR